VTRAAAAIRTLTASVDSTQKNLTRLTTEVEGLRDEIRQAQLARDTYFTQVVAKTDDLHVAHGTLTRLKEREGQLVERIAHYKNKMAEIGIRNPDAPLTGAAPTIAGQVLAVRGDNLIEVSIGADDGLREGHTVEVFRASSYLGRAEIVRTAPDRAVAKVMPETRRGVIQKGDRVATRLRS
jgi:hypothetical protein